MLSLNAQNNIIYFKDIKSEHLPFILSWYNKVDDFKFATGIDKEMSLEDLKRKYAEVTICSHEFFVGIYEKKEGKMIGIIKGRLHYENEDTVWISSIVIDLAYQRKGYGSSAIDLLLNSFKVNNKIKNAYLAVIEENIQGKDFWFKKEFKEVRRIENHVRLQNKQQNVLVMYKQI